VVGLAFRILWGGDVESALRPVVVVNLLSSFAFSTFWSFVGIWAVKRLGASAPQVGVMFLFSASTSAVAAYIGGKLSDRVGRKPVIVTALAAEALAVPPLIAADHRVALGFALVVVAGVVGAPTLAASSAIVADLVDAARQEQAYAVVRVANNIGVVLGPVTGGLLILLAGWPGLFSSVGALGLLSSVVAFRFLPNVGARSADEEGQLAVSLRLIARDRPFVLLLGSVLFAFVVYVGFETVLPVVAVASYGMAASTWGFLVIINPVLVALLQVRVTRRVEAASPTLKLVAASGLMGFPFLLLLANSSVPMIALVIFVFVFGEMLWVPTSQALAARIAPPQVRGAYMGAYTGCSAIAWMLAPLAGLQLRAAGGDAAVWFFFATVAVLAAGFGAAADQGSRHLRLRTAVAGPV
jgi:MFS family permease